MIHPTDTEAIIMARLESDAVNTLRTAEEQARFWAVEADRARRHLTEIQAVLERRRQEFHR